MIRSLILASLVIYFFAFSVLVARDLTQQTSQDENETESKARDSNPKRVSINQVDEEFVFSKEMKQSKNLQTESVIHESQLTKKAVDSRFDE